MDTIPPASPPYGSLIELARRSAGLPIQRAATAAGISKATWIDNARGHRKRGGVWEHIEPKPETIARMARAVGLSPERLQDEGQRADAAKILREILRTPSSPAHAVPEPPPGDPGDPAAQVLADLLARYPDDQVVQAIGARRKAARIRVNEILQWLEIQAKEGSGTAG